MLKALPILIALATAVFAQDAGEKPADPKAELGATVAAAMKKEDYAAAEKALTAWIESGKGDFDALSGRAAVRLLSGNVKGCQEDFAAAGKLDREKAAKLKFFLADRAIWKARKLEMDGHHEQALKIYDGLLVLYPKSAPAYHDRGCLKIDIKDYDGAIADLTKAIEFDDGTNAFGDSYTLRARAKRAKGDEAGAKEDDAKANAAVEAQRSKEDAAPASGKDEEEGESE